MFVSARRANTHGRVGCQGESFLPRVHCQDFRDGRESYAKQEDQDVQGAWEREEELKAKFPSLFSDPSESRG
jgi:hypothetical protein